MQTVTFFILDHNSYKQPPTFILDADKIYRRGNDYILFLNDMYYIYGWFRQNRALYIGKTRSGYRRLKQHNVINKIEPIHSTDKIYIWNNMSTNLLCYCEKDLIAHYRPKYQPHGHFDPLPYSKHLL